MFSVLLGFLQPRFWVNTKTVRSIASLSSLSETHQMLQKTCRDFAEAELKPNAAKFDRDHLYPKEQVECPSISWITCYKSFSHLNF